MRALRTRAAMAASWLTIVYLTACAEKTGVEVSEVELAPAPPGASMRAGYFTLTNHDDRTRTLSHARSAAWRVVEFHRTEVTDGVSRMRKERAITLPPHGRIVFKPYGRHLMLMHPTDKATQDPVVVELCFADGECLSTRYAVAK